MAESASSEFPLKIDESIQVLKLNSSLASANAASEPCLTPCITINDDILVFSHAPYTQIKEFLFKLNNPLLQIAFGCVLGSILTLKFGGTSAYSKQAIFPFEPNLRKAQTSGELLYALYAMGSSPNRVKETETVAKTSVVPSSPQAQNNTPLFVDRFYLPDASFHTEGVSSMVVVDRFYFSNPTVTLPVQPNQVSGLSFMDRYYFSNQSGLAFGTNSVNPSESSAAVSQDLPVPNLPVLNARASISDPATRVQSTVSSPAPANTQVASTLLGVLVTQGLSAALFRTNNNTYPVRLGESVGSSQWVLSEIRQEKAILSRGNQTLMLNAGDSF